MSWLNLEAEVAAEFAADEMGDAVQEGFWQLAKERAARRHEHHTRRGGGASAPAPLPTTCAHCGDGFTLAATGRPQKFCSGRCRVAAHRAVTKPVASLYGEQHPSPALTGFDPDRNA